MSVETTTVSPPRRKRPDRQPKEPDSTTPSVSPTNGIKPLSLRRNFSWTLVGNVIRAACQWGILIAMTRIISAHDVGQWGFAMAIATPVCCFLDFNLRLVMVTDVNNRNCFGDYFGIRLVTMGIGLITLLGIGVFARLDSMAFLILLAVGLDKNVEAIGYLFHGVAQKKERLDWVAKMVILKGVATLGVFATTLYFSRSILVSILAMIGVRIAMILVVEYPCAARIIKDSLSMIPRFCLSAGWQLALRALPLGCVALLFSIYIGIPKFFIKSYHGNEMLGLFTAIGYLQALGRVVVFALMYAALGRMAREYSIAPRRMLTLFVKLLTVASIIGILGILFAWCFGYYFIKYVYGAEYTVGKNVFVWFMVFLAGTELNTFASTALMAMQRFRTYAVLTGVATVICLLMSWCLVPNHGMLGGAWALTGSIWITCILGIGYVFVSVSKANNKLEEKEQSPLFDACVIN